MHRFVDAVAGELGAWFEVEAATLMVDQAETCWAVRHAVCATRW